MERNHGTRGRRNDKDTEFKSKNLFVERKRRQKNHDMLVTLRALVPNITNVITLLKKATIIDDAMTYITGLKNRVKDLTDQLAEIEATFEKDEEHEIKDDITHEIEKCNIENEVKVTQIDKSDLCVKIICQSKTGIFRKLMETIRDQGLEVTDMNFTNSKGVNLVVFSVEVTQAKMVASKQVKRYLQELIRSYLDTN
ncbi:hypothetical protein IFM89_038299 [Coptis chinensis]|uniref:BHLH domain-containing protein n=1 Tax=Coptis chinensis TaxID=261450 RepID=A0A835H340_9MAGN|nr:hypothetical protein IFM89_038299 [Coptis chinensis]